MPLITPILLLAAFAPAPPPNVVLILADDLGWGEVGCHGQEKIPTPNIDRLAIDGMRLTSHWSGSPVCAPSRCVLLTGKHPGHAAVRNNWEAGGWGPDQTEGQFPLPDEEVTLAEVLGERGYTTGAIGKWGLGGPDTEGHPNRQGFDHWFGYLCQRVAHNYYPTHLWRNGEKVPLKGNSWFSAHQKIEQPLDREQAYEAEYLGETFASDLMRDEAVQFIENHAKDGPFFLYYASPVPHVALQVPPDRLDAFPSEWDTEPYLGQKGYVPHPRPRAAYAAMIAGLDAEVGEILEALEHQGVAGSTIVIFTSDNGPTYAGGVDHEFFESAGPFRGLKGSVFEGGLRVPTIVRWPGHVPPGTTADIPSGFEDHLPTLCELTGTSAPTGIDGQSLASVLLGDRSTPAPTRPYLYRELGGQQAIRVGPWKGVRRHLRRGDTTMLLFNLDTDPGETTNVAAEHPDIVARLETLLADAHVPSPDFPLPTIDK
ncbi:MAG: arylsulfatase [Phycisphaerales bacterium]|nr:arylsulfatase [Phycisphaerales bacterium]